MKQKIFCSAFVKLTAVVLFCTVLIGSVASTSVFRADAAVTQDELEQKCEELEREEKEISAALEQAKQDVADQEAYYTQLGYKISNTESQIYTMSQRISVLNAEISQKEEEIAKAQKRIDENYELFKMRLRAMYMSNDATVLSVLFGSSTFSEFLSAAETTQRIAEHDDQLIKELTAQMKQIEADKAAIEESRRQIESDKAALETKQNELNATRTEANQVLNELEGKEAQTQEEYERIVALKEEARRELAAFILQNQSGGTVVSGDWLWPVVGYTYISSYFGNRWFNGVLEGHKGIDIPCATGTPIRASKAGTVLRSYTSSSYGECVVIDHGGGYTTLYAHNSQRLVYAGETVAQGQTIALAGSTGQSTGSHCHFEVMINAVPQNPLNYVKATG